MRIKRTLALILALVMVLGMMPTTFAFAEETTEPVYAESAYKTSAPLPQVVLDDLAATGTGLKQVYDFCARDSLTISGTPWISYYNNDTESDFGKSFKGDPWAKSWTTDAGVTTDYHPQLLQAGLHFKAGTITFGSMYYDAKGSDRTEAMRPWVNKGYHWWVIPFAKEIPENVSTFLTGFNWYSPYGGTTFQTALKEMIGEKPTMYIRLKIEGELGNTTDPTKGPFYYWDRIIFVNPCDSHFAGGDTETVVTPATCGTGSVVEVTCAACEGVKTYTKEDATGKHNMSYKWDKAANAYTATCADCGASKTLTNTDGPLPQELLTALNAEGIGLEHVYDYSAATSDFNTAYVQADAESIVGKAVVSEERGIDKPFATTGGSPSNVTLGTVTAAQESVNRNKGYFLYKIGDNFVFPETTASINYVYSFPTWHFQNKGITADWSKFVGHTADIYVSMKVVYPGSGNPTYYVDRMFVVDKTAHNPETENCFGYEPTSYTVTVNGVANSVAEFNAFTLPEFTGTAPQGKKFTGWQINGTDYAVGDRIIVTDDVTVDAVYIDHTYSAVVTDPTCTEAGSVTYTCTVCGDTYTEAGEPALGHDMAYKWDKAGNQYVATCANGCGTTSSRNTDAALPQDVLTALAEEGIGLEHVYDYTEADFVVDGVYFLRIDDAAGANARAIECESSAKSNANYIGIITDIVVSTSKGYTLGTITLDQQKANEGKGYVLYKLENITLPTDASGDVGYLSMFRNTVVQNRGIWGTLNSLQGHTADLYISMRIDGKFNWQQPYPCYGIDRMILVDKSSHSDDCTCVAAAASAAAYTYAAGEGTGTMDGAVVTEHTYITLPECAFTAPTGYEFAGWKIGNAIAQPGETALISEDTEIVATYTESHVCEYTEEVTKQPTCTEKGVKTFTCTCGASYTEEIDALGHTEAEAVVENKVEADCDTEGSYDTVVYCSVCGEELSRETTTVDALGHTEAEAVVENEVAATCGADGSYDNVVYCAVCKAELDRETVVVPATGEHVYAEETKRVEATCTEDGYYVMACGCGATKTTTIPATGHTEAEAVVENKVEADCDTEGSYDTVVYCSVCGEELSRETTTVDALGHSYDAVVTAPTYNAQGYTTYTCSVCGDSYVSDYVDALIAAAAADGVKYGTFAEALAAVTAGSTLELLADAEIAAPLTITADLTINGNGHTLTYTGSDRAITVESGMDADLTVKNLTVVAAKAQRGINYNTTGALVLDKVTVSGATYAVNLPGSSDGAVVTITDSSLSGNIALNVWGENAVINVSDTDLIGVDKTDVEGYSTVKLNNDSVTAAEGSVITITGGSISAEDDSYAYSNSTVTGTINVSDTTTVTGDVGGAVAVIKYGDNSYSFATLADAIEKAQDGETVTLLKDVSVSEIIVLDKAITLDGNGKTLTSTAGRAINVSGANGVTIKNLTINASGERAINVIQNATNVTVENVTATAGNYTVNVASSAPNAVITIKNSTLTGLNTVNVAAAGAQVTVTGGKITCNDQTDVESYSALALNKDATGASIVANGVEFEIKGDSSKAITGATNGTITIDGSTDEVIEDIAYISYGNTYYGFSTLADAVAKAKDGETIVLLKDASGEGVVIDKDVTIDFDGYTYTFTSGVGSYDSCGFQILKDNTVVLENGTLNVAEESKATMYMLVQNYANLTVTDMVLDGTNLDKYSNTDQDSYVLSNNSGNVVINGETDIIANDEGTLAYAFDVCKYNSYAAPTVTVNTTGTINGNVEVTGGDLNVEAATINGALVYTSGTATKAENVTLAAPEGYKWVNGVLTAVDYVAEADGVKYESLAEAIANGTSVKLLKDASGEGAVINKDVTIDFGGFTYTFTSGVGSGSLTSNGFQILKDNTVVLKNGTLNVAAEDKTEFYTLIQNYANLTVTDMVLDGTNLDKWSATDGDSYTLSNNSGNVVINGATDIIANDEGALAYALDACDNGSYVAPVVTVNTTGTINGNVEVTGGDLNVEAATINGALVYTAGNVTKAETVTLAAPEGYEWVNGVLTAVDYVAEADGVKYESLVEAIANGTSVKLLADVTLTEMVKVAKAVTIDLNGFSITGDVDDAYGMLYVSMAGDLTVKGEGTISNTNADAVTIGNYGKVTVEAGNVDGILYNFYYNDTTYGTATINGGKVATLWNCGEATVNGGEVAYIDNTAELTVKAGTVGELYIGTPDYKDAPATATVAAGTVATMAELPEGYAALNDLKGNVVIGEEPTATANNLGEKIIPEGEWNQYTGSLTPGVGDLPLSFVMQFKADQDEADMATSPYADWYGDFVLTFTGIEEGSFTADGCYLAGFYGDFGWIKIPVDGMEIEDGIRYPVMLGVGMGQKYDYICTGVQDFLCALYIPEEILAANPNLEVNLELAVVDNSQGSDAARDALIANENVYEVADHTYTAADFKTSVAKIGETFYATLAKAVEAAEAGAVIELLANTDEVVTVNMALTINKNGYTAANVTAGADVLMAVYEDKYAFGTLPNAEIELLNDILVDVDSHYIYDLVGNQSLTTSTDPFNLQVAMKFTAKDTLEQAQANAFSGYTTDFFIKIDGLTQESFVGDGCYLAGYYPWDDKSVDDGLWVVIPLDGFTVENGVVYPMISAAGFDFKYTDIVSSVGQFICGIYLTPEVMEANPNLTVQLDLGLSENQTEAQKSNYIEVDTSIYDVEDINVPYVAQVTTAKFKALSEAVAYGDAVELLADTDEAVVLNVNTVINRNGFTASALSAAAGYEVVETADTYTVAEVVIPDAKYGFSDSMQAFLSLESIVEMNVGFKMTKDNVELTPEEAAPFMDKVGLLVWKGAAVSGEATIENSEIVLTNVTYNTDKNRFEVKTDGIPAKEMGDALCFRPYYVDENGNYSYGRLIENYSPKKYSYIQIAAGGADTAVNIALLNYGAAAQVHFNYNVDNLMNADLTDEQKAMNWDGTLVRSDWAIPEGKEGDLTRAAEISTRGAYLSLEGTIDVNFYSMADAEIVKAEMLLWNEADYNAADVLSEENASQIANMSKNESKNRYEYKYEGIAAKEMFFPIYGCAKFTDVNGNVYYSGVVAYCAERAAYVGQNDVDANLADLYKRIAIYGDAARTYFGNR